MKLLINKSTIAFICMFLLTYNMNANPIGLTKAKKVAKLFLSTSYVTPEKSSNYTQQIASKSLIPSNNDLEPPYYVFNRRGGGFVIVSNSSKTFPILAYSFKSQFDLNNCPDGLKLWLDRITDAIINAETNTIIQENEKQHNNTFLSFMAGTSNATKLETAEWGQGDPFNRLCPSINDKHCYTGCLPTAMSIIMQYWKWPAYGQGHIPAYYYDNLGNGYHEFDPTGRYPDRVIYKGGDYDLGYQYDWDKMLLSYSNSYTPEQAEAVSTLIRDCGAIVQAAYGLNATGAVFDYAYYLKDYMGFDKALQLLDERKCESFVEWKKILKKEIMEGRPVLMSGWHSEGGGHAYVIDGFDDNDYFSINWGWNGYNNGFFLTDPYIDDTHSSTTYFISQNAFTGIQPDKGGLFKYSLKWLAGDEYLKIENNSIEPSVPFTLINTNQMTVNNWEKSDYYGDYAAAIFRSNGELKSVISEPRKLILAGGMPTKISNCIINEWPDVGDYLTIVFRSKGYTEWEPVHCFRSQMNATIYLNESESLEEETSIRIDPNIKEVLFGYRKETSQLIDIKTMLGTEFFIYDSSGKRVDYVETEGGVRFNYAKISTDSPDTRFQRYYIFFSNLPPGRYKIVLNHSLQYKEIEFTR